MTAKAATPSTRLTKFSALTGDRSPALNTVAIPPLPLNFLKAEKSAYLRQFFCYLYIPPSIHPLIHPSTHPLIHSSTHPPPTMLTFYYHPLSPIARRVWLALLEKQLAFEPRLVDLKEKAQLQPEYLAIHPFHHVPALVDGDLRLIESLAILDYLEAQFPETPLSPTEPAAIAQMKMVQLVIANELMPKLSSLVLLADAYTPTDEALLQHVDTVFQFLAEQLGGEQYFGGDRLSLADITVGSTLPLIHRMGVSLQEYSPLAQWCDRVSHRPAWQQTDPTAADLQAWQRWLTVMMKRRQKRA